MSTSQTITLRLLFVLPIVFAGCSRAKQSDKELAREPETAANDNTDIAEPAEMGPRDTELIVPELTEPEFVEPKMAAEEEGAIAIERSMVREEPQIEYSVQSPRTEYNTSPMIVSPVDDGSGGFTREKVYFATNREQEPAGDIPNDFFVSELGELRFGACEVSIPYNRKAGTLPEPSLWKLELTENPKKHIVLLNISLMEKEALRKSIEARMGNSPEKEVLLFIHGYNNSFRDAARRTAQLAYDLNFQGAAVFYSWPAGNPNYLADLRNAQSSTDECVELLRMISKECGAKKIHVIAHSMGNFVLANSLERMSNIPTDASGLRAFHHIALAAPDINAKVFRTKIAPKIQGLANRFTVYASQSDLAMDASRKANSWDPLGDVNKESKRVGELPYVDFIDATEISKQSWFSVGHAYYGDMPQLIRDVRDLFLDVPAADRKLRRAGSTYVMQP